MLPTLYTERLILRPLDHKDALDFYSYATSNLVGPRAGWEPHRDLNETKQILKNMIEYKTTFDLGHFAVVLKSTNKMIGMVELYNYISNFKAVLGYSLNPTYWGHGYIPEACFKVLEYAFCVLHLKRVEAATFVDNYQSQRVCEKIGMTREGVSRKAYLRYDDKIFDEVFYGITDDEFFKILSEEVKNEEEADI